MTVAEGVTPYIDADLHEPDKILRHPELRQTLDLSRTKKSLPGSLRGCLQPFRPTPPYPLTRFR
jgi:hypothetical protein